MSHSEKSDAFSKALGNKPRHSHINQLKKQFEDNENTTIGTSVNRLSRVFEATHLDPIKPVPPSKPPSLKPNPLNKPTEPEVDQIPLAFNDIRAKFQQNNIPTQNEQKKYRVPIPLQPSKTGPPPPLPEKMIIATKTGPPALPAKPKVIHLPPSKTIVEDHRLSYASSNYPIIPVITRTTTGNSSTSNSSQNSSSVQSHKRGWHLTNWFTHQQTQQQQLDHEQLKNSIRRPDDLESIKTISPQLTGVSLPDKSGKRTKVVRELVDTEVAYQKDMNLLKKIYYDGAHRVGLSALDIKQLFSNLIDIVEFELTFVALLENSCEADTIGMAFRESMRVIDKIYSEYCKRHEDAVIKLQELEIQPETQQFLTDCKEQIQGKTTSWDLGSLLIKPVQRVLKYPLLLKEILSLTPPTHDDHDDLSAAVKEIQDVADNINEIKKRKDIVEKIVGDKRKTEINVVHGINKKFTRRAQKLKQATGFAVEPTHDAEFEALHMKFEEQQELIKQLARDVQGWVRHVKIGFDNLQQLACSIETMYSSWGGVRVASLTAANHFNQLASYLSTNLSRELDNDVRGFVYSRIDDFLKVFENPTQVIEKRATKMIDFDRVRDMKLKGDVPDKALQQSADAYVSINGQLVDELPKFFALTHKYFDILIGGIAFVQMKFYGLMQREWIKLVEQQLGMEAASTFEEIVKIHAHQMDKVENLTSQIGLLQKPKYANTHRNNSSSASSLLLKQRSKEVPTPKLTIDSSSEYSSVQSGFYAPAATTLVASPETENLIYLDEGSPNDFDCIVLYDFETHEQGRLDVKRGTILRVTQDENFIDQDWWFGTTEDSRSGWIPINYCKKI